MTNEKHPGSIRLAVLIDADNANADLIEPLVTEIAKYGISHVKRIYGDWTNSRLNKWKDKLNKFAIQPIQQFEYTTGKNSTDSALIIDAMDLLYTQNFDGFCIVSSDSDFTRLASRIREAGLVVYGFGEKKTPEAFISACDKFIYTEILRQLEIVENTTTAHSVAQETDKQEPKFSVIPKDEQKLRTNKKLIELLKDAYEAVDDEDGWAHLGVFGAQITKLSSSFDSRNYGYKKLSDLVRATDMFEVRETPHGKNATVKDLHIRLKS